MKKIFLSLIISLIVLPAFAGSKGSFTVANKNNELTDFVTLINNPLDIQRLNFTVDINPNDIKKFDKIEIVVRRNPCMKGYFTFWSKDITSAADSEYTKGNKMMFIKIFNLANKDGNGMFYNEQYQQFINNQYILSKKGHNYGKSKPVDEYELEAYVAGLKIIKYEKKYVNGKMENVPVFGKSVYIIDPVKIKIKTTDKVAPLRQSPVVKDSTVAPELKF